MAATSQGILALQQGRLVADFKAPSNRSLQNIRSRGQVPRGLVLPSSRSFRAFRTIKKSPRLNRSVVMRFSMGDQNNMSNYLSKDLREDDVMRPAEDDENMIDENSTSDAVVETVNAVLADIVDGQKYIKETGRTKPRPMKRRALVVALALGAFRGPLNDVESRLGSLRRSSSASRLSRTPSSSGFARTAQLISQLSFGSPHGTAEIH